MIQRIQTLFLLGAAILLTIMYFNPFISGAGELHINYTDSVAIAVLLILTTIIGYGNIFLYRRRMLQIRLCMFNCLLLLGLQGFIAYYVFTVKGVSFSITAAFPIIALVLTFLALRYIARDEAMLQAMNRLR